MKKIFAAALAACLFAASVPVFAATENYITEVETVMEEASFTMENAPQLVFRPSEDHPDEFSFLLILSGAEWNYGDAGNIAAGIDYEKATDTMLKINVSAAADAKNNRLRIPLFASMTGQTAIVTIDPMDSYVSGGTHVFAQVVGEEELTFGVTAPVTMGSTGKIPSIVIKDDGTRVYTNGEVIRLRLTNDFSFKGVDNLTVTGKFLGAVSVNLSDTVPAELEIKIESTTPAAPGRIGLYGLEIAAGEDSVYGPVDVRLEMNNGEGRTSVTRYEKPALPQKTKVSFTMGKKTYWVGETEVAMDAMPFIDINGRSLLPLRALANAVDVADEDILWNASSRTVTLRKDGKTVSVAIGSNLITVDGLAKTMDTAAVIVEGRTYLPLRAVLNALGFADADIAWDDWTKTVTVMK